MQSDRCRIWKIVAGIALSLATSLAGAYPAVFPVGTTIHDPQRAQAGYTLFTVAGVGITVLVDMDGTEVRRWDTGSSYMVAPLPGGRVLAVTAAALRELDWDGVEVWRYDSGECSLHHDVQRLEDGRTLALCRRPRTMPEISDQVVIDDEILLIDRDGTLLQRWSTGEHFDQLGLTQAAVETIRTRGGDWAHTNSIQVIPDNDLGDPRFAPGNILVSQRQTSLLFVIDRITGDVVWTQGQNDLFMGQHQARLLPRRLPGAGEILLFDNGGYAGYPLAARLYSRVFTFDPISGRVTWIYLGGDRKETRFQFFSPFMSGAQRLANGNTLICSSWDRRLFEVTAGGDIVWEYISPYTDDGGARKIYRAYRLPYDWAPVR